MSNYYTDSDDATLGAASLTLPVAARAKAARIQQLAAAAAESARVAKAFRYAANRPKSRGKVQQILQLLRDWGLPGEDLRRALPRWEQKAAADLRALVLAKKAARRGLASYEPDADADAMLGTVAFGPSYSEGILRAQEQANRAEAAAAQAAANDAATAAQADPRAQNAYNLMQLGPAARAAARERAAREAAERQKAEAKAAQAELLARQSMLVLQRAAAERAAAQRAAAQTTAVQQGTAQVLVNRAAAGSQPSAAERYNLEIAQRQAREAERRVALQRAVEARAARLAAEDAQRAAIATQRAAAAAEKQRIAAAKRAAAAEKQRIAAARRIAAEIEKQRIAAARRAARGTVVAVPPPPRGTVVAVPPPPRGTVVAVPPPPRGTVVAVPPAPTGVVVKPSGVVVTPRGTVVATPPAAPPFANIANLAKNVVRAGGSLRDADAMIAAIRAQIARNQMHHDVREIVAMLQSRGVRRGSHRPLAAHFRDMTARNSGDRANYFATLSAYLGM
jgi:hypothetical protein